MNRFLKIFIIFSLIFSGCAGILHEGEKEDNGTLVPPMLLNKTPLQYPEEARLNGLEGSVGLYIFVDVDGNVSKIRLHSSSNHALLDTAAEEYVRHFKFRPAQRAGENVGIWLSYKIDYSLRMADLTFDFDQWFEEVSSLMRRLEGPDSGSSEEAADRLLELYEEYSVYINRNPEKNYNSRIDQILSQSSREKWQSFYDLCPLTFTLYADLLKRFPDIPKTEQALLKMNNALENDIERAAGMSEKKLNGPQLFKTFARSVHQFLLTKYKGKYPQQLDVILKNYQ